MPGALDAGGPRQGADGIAVDMHDDVDLRPQVGRVDRDGAAQLSVAHGHVLLLVRLRGGLGAGRRSVVGGHAGAVGRQETGLVGRRLVDQGGLCRPLEESQRVGRVGECADGLGPQLIPIQVRVGFPEQLRHPVELGVEVQAVEGVQLARQSGDAVLCRPQPHAATLPGLGLCPGRGLGVHLDDQLLRQLERP